jgi:hypothetical protein
MSIEGLGATTTAGTGGTVYTVTLLDDYEGCEAVPGTFRWALAQGKPTGFAPRDPVWVAQCQPTIIRFAV